MTIEAKIVADSINPTDNRLTTWLLKYPRSIHAELMTHRAFSRNSASSRAIPIERMIQNVLNDPFIPKWSAAHPGMTITDEIEEDLQLVAQIKWMALLNETVKRIRGYDVGWLNDTHITGLAELGLAKSVVNRLLEPWAHIEVVLSATEWNNWFLLRDDKAAEPHIRELAHMMKELYSKSEPISRGMVQVSVCQLADKTDCLTAVDSSHPFWWHRPFIKSNPVYDRTALYETIKESVAHAAWVSYGNAAGKEGFTQADVDNVYDKLVGSQPIHASPTEHVAVACNSNHRHGNFVGWCQWRQFLPNQSGGDYES